MTIHQPDVEEHAHYLVDVSISHLHKHASVSLWTRDREQVHEFIAEAKAQGYRLARLKAVRCDWAQADCECAR